MPTKVDRPAYFKPSNRLSRVANGEVPSTRNNPEAKQPAQSRDISGAVASVSSIETAKPTVQKVNQLPAPKTGMKVNVTFFWFIGFIYFSLFSSFVPLYQSYILQYILLCKDVRSLYIPTGLY